MNPEKRNSQGETVTVCFICVAIIAVNGPFVKHIFADKQKNVRFFPFIVFMPGIKPLTASKKSVIVQNFRCPFVQF